MNKILIAYATYYGSTEKIVKLIAENLPGAEICNLKKNPWPSLEEFEVVVIGGPIHAGKMHPAVRKFCRKNEEKLLTKKLALFITCMYDGQKAEEQFNRAFSKPLKAAAKEKAILGGEFNLEKLNFMERFILKNFIGAKQSASRLHPEQIINFAGRIRSLTEQI
ncbi:MAG: flavodoxin domain-containing protein [Candidatus Aminicenantes bacterium]|nr:flavodoxin domain-containing protein [Candidatus Aminicenantes bacterium]